ncbi:MAG: hypothetical protein KDK78_06640, partial [Chlamydiia bacterium]|nr:hypothetical protein [Chlamydiia bacterium]
MSSKALKYILLFTAQCVAWSLPAEEPKPKIFLYMCSYGSGHRMATQAIVERLGDYDLQVVDVYDGPLLPLDPLRQVAPEVSQESCFNFMAKQEWNSALNLTRVLSNQVLLLKRRKIEGWLWDHLEECSPD